LRRRPRSKLGCGAKERKKDRKTERKKKERRQLFRTLVVMAKREVLVIFMKLNLEKSSSVTELNEFFPSLYWSSNRHFPP
jgi:hypothetical protein